MRDLTGVRALSLCPTIDVLQMGNRKHSPEYRSRHLFAAPPHALFLHPHQLFKPSLSQLLQCLHKQAVVFGGAAVAHKTLIYFHNINAQLFDLLKRCMPCTESSSATRAQSL